MNNPLSQQNIVFSLFWFRFFICYKPTLQTPNTEQRQNQEREVQKVTSDKHLQEETARTFLSSPTGTPTSGLQVFPKSGQDVSSTILYTATLEVDRKLKAN